MGGGHGSGLDRDRGNDGLRRIWTTAIITGVCLAACPDGPEVCREVTCSVHGVCVVEGGRAACVCDEGHRLAGLECIPLDPPSGLGSPCDDSSDCAPGFCFEPRYGNESYCSHENCQVDADCQAGAADDANLCCIPRPGEPAVCTRTAASAPCGDRTGACGTPCAGGLDSICAAGLECIRAGDDDPNAFCTHECERDADCASCGSPWVDPCGCDVLACMPIVGGDLRCLPVLCDCCFNSRECPGDQVCIPWPSEVPPMLMGDCNKLGDLATGDACDPDTDPNDLPAAERCAGFYCLDGRCSEVCDSDDTCPDPMVCRPTELPLFDGTFTIDMCRWPE